MDRSETRNASGLTLLESFILELGELEAGFKKSIIAEAQRYFSAVRGRKTEILHGRNFMPKKRSPADRISYSHKIYAPYVAALGQLALAWNGFHETLSLLFCRLVAEKHPPTKFDNTSGQLLAIWHALKSDRGQREILQAAVENHTWGAVPTSLEEGY